MLSLLANMIGYSAAVVGTALMLPQVIKSIKTKKVDDLSFVMVMFYFLNCGLWLTYGILIFAIPIIITNFLALIISIIQIILKIQYR